MGGGGGGERGVGGGEEVGGEVERGGCGEGEGVGEGGHFCLFEGWEEVVRKLGERDCEGFEYGVC